MMFKTPVVLTLAWEGMSLGNEWDEIHEAIEHVLGHPVWTHELANKAPWQRAGSLVRTQYPALPVKGSVDVKALHAAGELDAWIAKLCAEHGPELELAPGTDERTESPMESMARMFPDKPILAVVTKEESP